MEDRSVLQPLPVVVVRNKSGDVLRLRRCENRQDNPLHRKIVVWAGGHVREEDGTPVNSLLPCAVRELQEELRLSVEETQLRLTSYFGFTGRSDFAGSDRQLASVRCSWTPR